MTLSALRIKFCYVGSILFFLISFPLRSENLLVCERQSPLLQKCSIQEQELTRSPDYEKEYTVNYHFRCKGHRTKIGIKSGAFFQELTAKDEPQEFVLISSEALELFDPDPLLTKRLSFHPKCSLSILDIKQRPSKRTLEDWVSRKQAKEELLFYLKHSFLDAQDVYLYKSGYELLDLAVEFQFQLNTIARNDFLSEDDRSFLEILRKKMERDSKDLSEYRDALLDKIKFLEEEALYLEREILFWLGPSD